MAAEDGLGAAAEAEAHGAGPPAKPADWPTMTKRQRKNELVQVGRYVALSVASAIACVTKLTCNMKQRLERQQEQERRREQQREQHHFRSIGRGVGVVDSTREKNKA